MTGDNGKHTQDDMYKLPTYSSEYDQVTSTNRTVFLGTYNHHFQTPPLVLPATLFPLHHLLCFTLLYFLHKPDEAANRPEHHWIHHENSSHSAHPTLNKTDALQVERCILLLAARWLRSLEARDQSHPRRPP